MGRIECGDGEDGEPVGAHRADPDGRRRAGVPAGTWMTHWGGREAGVASRISSVSFETLVTTWLVEVGCCNRSWSAPSHSSHDGNLHAD